MSGGKKKQTVGYKYHLGFQAVYCHGPIDALLDITWDDKLAWSGYAGDETITIFQPGLFGGESREGGIAGDIDVMLGTSTQAKNSYLVGKLGSSISACRRYFSLVFNQFYLGNNPYLKKPSIRVFRATTGWDGAEQWYVSKSVVPTCGYEYSVIGNYQFNVDWEADAGTTHAAALSAAQAAGNVITGLEDTDTVVVTDWEYGSYVAGSKYGTTSQSSWGFTVYFNENSTLNTTPSTAEYTSYAAANDAAESFLPVEYTGYTDYAFGLYDDPINDNIGGVSLNVEVRRTLGDMNPAHIIRECLLSDIWGMGSTDSDIDDTNFRAVADALYDEGFGLSGAWYESGTIDEFIEDILDTIDASLYPSPTDGKLNLKLIRDDYNPASLTVYDAEDIVSISDFKRPTIAELPNQVIIKYNSSITRKPDSAMEQDIALLQAQSGPNPITIDFPLIRCPSLAAKVALRELKAATTPIATFTIKMRRTGTTLVIGDVFKVTHPRYNISEMIVRVVNTDYGSLENNAVNLEVVEDVFSFGESTVGTQSGGTLWDNPKNVSPEASDYEIVVEMPYYEIAREIGDDDAEATDSDIGYFVATSVKPNSVSFKSSLYVDGATESTGTAPFCPSATISANVAQEEGSTTVAIGNTTDISNVDVGTYAYLNDEIIEIEAISESSITFGRGVLDTVPQAHTSGDRIFFVDSFWGTDQVEYADSETVAVKLCPTTPLGTLDPADATANNVTIASRQALPYPPGQVKLNSAYYPSEVSVGDDVVVTWVHRDRLQQTTVDLLDFKDGTVGPESGVTYTCGIYDGTDTLISETTGISGTTHTFTAATLSGDTNDNLTVKLKAVRSSLDSWQQHEITFYHTGAEAFEDSTNDPFHTSDSGALYVQL